MQFTSARPRAPPSSSRFAPIAPLPPPNVDAQCHYLRPSGTFRRLSQSESSVSDSDRSESDEERQSASEDDDGATSSDADSDSDASSSTRASLSSRSASVSSLSDSQDSFKSEEDEDGDHGLRLRVHDSSSVSTSVMSVSQRHGGAAWHGDNLGLLALLIPITGVSTMVLTEVLACANHFDCSTHYPTLSYAAEFKPEGHAFTLGMCATAIFILASVALFHWFLRLKLFHPAVDRATVLVAHGCLVSGAIAASALFGLAVFDMGAYHDAHIAFTVIFFIFAWVTMLAVQAARRRLLQAHDTAKPHRASASAGSAVWLALQRWKRISLREAYQLGRIFLYAGLSATGLFALLFLCVNGVWPNPLGFTAVQEAPLEAFAIVCQLFFMGTLSSELSKLTRVVEHRDYEELERAE